MKEKLSLLLSEATPPPTLCEHIIARILQARRRRAQIQLFLQGLLFFISGFLLVPLAQFSGKELFNSGFYEYAAMLFSGGYAYTFNREILYSLIESLPSFSILLITICLVSCAWSLRNALRSSKMLLSY